MLESCVAFDIAEAKLFNISSVIYFSEDVSSVIIFWRIFMTVQRQCKDGARSGTTVSDHCSFYFRVQSHFLKCSSMWPTYLFT